MNPQKYHFTLPEFPEPPILQLPEVWYPGVREYWKDCTSKRIYDPFFGINTVVIHATAGYSSAGAVSVMRDKKASFHWLIPDENEEEHGELIWACVPETRAAWHVQNAVSHPDLNEGKNKTNHWSLGVELVNSQVDDPFSDWQIQMAVDIVRYCWAKYPNMKHVVSHAKLDPSRRTDPGVDFPWEEFRARVLVENFAELLACNHPANTARAVRTRTVETIVPLPEIEGDICC